jgi:hypothetical protein
VARTKKSKNGLPPLPPNRLRSVYDDPPRGNVLLHSCMDQRLLDNTVQFMSGLNLDNRFDQIALAGGAMGVHRLPQKPPHKSATWWGLFGSHLSTAINDLDRPIKDVFLLDHLDCGAYKVLHPEKRIRDEYPEASLNRMRELHTDELIALAKKVHAFCEAQHAKTQLEETRPDRWEHIRVSCFIMDLRGKVTQLDDKNHQE